MKSISLFALAVILSYSTFAQRTIQIRNLWMKPQVHVLFEGYVVSFTIKDINKSLSILSDIGEHTYGTTSNLDTNQVYSVELYPGTRIAYRNELQPLLQKGVGAFLLTAGHAEIRNKKRKKLKEIIVDIGTAQEGENEVVVTVYDPKNKKMIFWGKMKVDMYNKDLGID